LILFEEMYCYQELTEVVKSYFSYFVIKKLLNYLSSENKYKLNTLIAKSLSKIKQKKNQDKWSSLITESKQRYSKSSEHESRIQETSVNNSSTKKINKKNKSTSLINQEIDFQLKSEINDNKKSISSKMDSKNSNKTSLGQNSQTSNSSNNQLEMFFQKKVKIYNPKSNSNDNIYNLNSSGNINYFNINQGLENNNIYQPSIGGQQLYNTNFNKQYENNCFYLNRPYNFDRLLPNLNLNSTNTPTNTNMHFTNYYNSENNLNRNNNFVPNLYTNNNLSNFHMDPNKNIVNHSFNNLTSYQMYNSNLQNNLQNFSQIQNMQVQNFPNVTYVPGDQLNPYFNYENYSQSYSQNPLNSKNVNNPGKGNK